MLTISVPIQSQIMGWGRWGDGRQWQPLMKSQCQSPMGGRAHTPDHLAITMSCPALWSHASRQWPPCKTGACHDSSYPSEYKRFFKDLLRSWPCPQYVIPVTYWGLFTLKLWGGWHCAWNSIWWMCSLNPHPKKTQKRESKFRNMCSVMGCSLVYSFAPCLWPILGSCD